MRFFGKQKNLRRGMRGYLAVITNDIGIPVSMIRNFRNGLLRHSISKRVKVDSMQRILLRVESSIHLVSVINCIL